MTAVTKLKEKAQEKSLSQQITEAEKPAVSIPTAQQSILTEDRRLNYEQRNCLLKKFQLAHFVAANNQPFNLYKKFAIVPLFIRNEGL